MDYWKIKMGVNVLKGIGIGGSSDPTKDIEENPNPIIKGNKEEVKGKDNDTNPKKPKVKVELLL